MDKASVSWKHAFPPLVLLATTAMSQPVGRLLNKPVVHSVWLRASPILHALDALGLIIRCLAYCIILRISPRKALLLIGSERFPADDAYADDTSTDNRATASTGEHGTASRFATIAKSLGTTGIRLVGFGFAVVSLVDLAITPGGHEARWTAAWGWTFVVAYAVLEVAAQVYRWEMAKPQYTAADFELGEIETASPNTVANNDTRNTISNDGDKSDDDDGDNGNTSDSSMSSAATLHVGSELRPKKSRKKRHARNQESSANDVDHEESNNLLSSSGAAASGGGDRDIEAEAGQHHYEYNDDPAEDPKLPALKAYLEIVDRMLLHVLGWPAHFIFIYWAFLDLIQPSSNKHILAVDFTNQTAPWNVVTDWGDSLLYLSLPFFLLAIGISMVVMLGTGVIGFFAFHAVSNFVVSQLPESVKGPDSTAWQLASILVSIVAGFMTCMTFGISTLPIINDILYSSHSMWIYEMLSFEIVVLLLYLAACFLLYVLIKYTVGRALGFEKKSPRLDRLDISPAGVIAREAALASQNNQNNQNNHTPLTGGEGVPRAAVAYLPGVITGARAYLTEEGCALFTAVIVSFVITLVWYCLRFQDSDHWLQTWRDTLQFVNTTAVADNSTLLANGTLDNSTAASASSVPQPVMLW